MKKVQVEGHLMFAEPQDLFGNLDELCYVSFVTLLFHKTCTKVVLGYYVDMSTMML